jgi:toxin ParE1/3/4
MTVRASLPVIWSARSIQDLAGIRAYIGGFAPLAAQRFTARLIATVESLAQHPNRGRLVSQGVRELVAVRPYLVLYKVTAEGVHIIHIKHGAQRPE